MINLKTKDEIKLMIEGGNILKKTVAAILPLVSAGTTTLEIDKYAEEQILLEGAKPSFKTVKDYHFTICAPVNEEVVHTPPSGRILKKGDIITIDIGVLYKGFHTDFATTFVVDGPANKKIEEFLNVGKETLNKAISKVAAGSRLGLISKTIFDEITSHKYSIIRDLTGHGIGRELHEDPLIPGFVDVDIDKTSIIKSGMVLAIEIIYCLGSGEIEHDQNDWWNVLTRDRSLSACFEHTIAVDGEKVLTLT